MIKLRDLIKRKNFFINKDGHAVPNEPVAFKNIKNFFINKDGHAVPNEPVTFKNIKKIYIKESLINEKEIDKITTGLKKHWSSINDNNRIGSIS